MDQEQGEVQVQHTKNTLTPRSSTALSLKSKHKHDTNNNLKPVGDTRKGNQAFLLNFLSVVFSPLFLRQRSVFFFILELLVPALVALTLLAAFTAGIAWQLGQAQKNEANARIVKFPVNFMDETIDNFRAGHADREGRVLIFFTPVTTFTTAVMQNTLDILRLRDTNILFKHGEINSGAVGLNNETEVIGCALHHRVDQVDHGQPVGVKFKYNPKAVSELTGVPYNLTYTISMFDKEIARTAELHPYIPPAKSETWRTPYLTSGFLGLQYAIEESIIRLIIEKQEAADTNVLEKKSAAANARELSEGETEDDILTSDNIDEKLFAFLNGLNAGKKSKKSKKDAIKEFRNNLRTTESPNGRMGSLEDSPSDTPQNPIITASELPQRSLKAFSYEHVAPEKFRHLLMHAITLSLVVSYSFMSFFTVWQIATENSSGILEIMQIHGLQPGVHWAILLFHALVCRAIASAFVLMALRIDYGNGKVAEVSDLSILYLLIYIHQLSLTFMNYFIGMCIKSLGWCCLVAVSSCVLSFLVPEAFAETELIGSFADIIASFLFPNWCFRHAIACLMNHEANEKGTDWNVMFERENGMELLSVGGGMSLLFFVGLFYIALAVYAGSDTSLSFIIKGILGKLKEALSKKTNKVQPTRIFKPQNQNNENGLGEDEDFVKPTIFEEPDPDTKCLVSIRNLCKTYGKHQVALRSLNVDIVHEEITVFLGYSGSGKTTLISILAGLVSPSEGKAIINEFDVTLHRTFARQYIGVCPQKLVAFNILTVQEHLCLCYKLCGYTSKDCNQRVAAMLSEFKLWKVRTLFPNNLRNDESRRLGIALSLVGAPKVILLDEPTKGMDAMSRREMWDVLSSMRQRHTIIITTNYMDEAEYLADKVALLAFGRLICYGSLDYLKSQYRTGYLLKLVPNGEKLNEEAVLSFVSGIFGSDVEIKENQHQEEQVDIPMPLELVLPSSEMNLLDDFCDEIDKKMEDLKILKYSVRQISLNEKFIQMHNSLMLSDAGTREREDSVGEIPVLPDGFQKNFRCFSQFKILFKRSFTLWKSKSQLIILHLLVPLLVIMIIVFQAKVFVEVDDVSPEMELSTARFEPLTSFYHFTEDDPEVDYEYHTSAVLSSYGAALDKQDLVTAELYEVLNTSPERLGYIKDEHMVAFEFGRKRQDLNFVGYFATGALHSAPVALNVMNNVLLSVISEPERDITKDWRPYKVTVRNAPMPQVEEARFEQQCGMTCVLLAMSMSFALSFISHTCVILPTIENENGMKSLILMSKVHPSTYWFAFFVMDFPLMFIMSTLIIFIFLLDLYETFYSVEVIFAVWIVCGLYLLWSSLMYCYYMISTIPTKINCYILLGVLHFVLGLLVFLWMTLVKPDSDFGIFWRNFLLLMLPPFTITSAFHLIFINAGQRNICKTMTDIISSVCSSKDDTKNNYLHNDFKNLDPKLIRCCVIQWFLDRLCKLSPNEEACYDPPHIFSSAAESWDDPGLTTHVFLLLLQGFIFWGLLVLVERAVFSRMMQNTVRKLLQGHTKQHAPPKLRQVIKESISVDRILNENTWPDDVALVCQNLTKSTSSAMVIKNFNLAVKNGQCVAILGRGNSGKSCIMRTIAGQTLPTEGNIYVKDASLLTDRKKYLCHFGYCPQNCSFYSGLTAESMLKFMGRLRGIPSIVLSTHVAKWLSALDLDEVAHDICAEYGDGIIKRLAVAMAIIGEPDIIILDEPTSGVDPATRECLWGVIKHLKQSGSTIIFTTYNTEEAFSLADKVVVIAEGGIQCIGQPDEIQEIYARGHTLTFQLRLDAITKSADMPVTEFRIAEFKEFVSKTYEYIDLLDENEEMIRYFLRDARLPWSEAFRRGQYLSIEFADIIASFEVIEGAVDDIFVFLANKHFELAKPKENETPELGARKKSEVGENELEELEKAYKRRHTLA